MSADKSAVGQFLFNGDNPVIKAAFALRIPLSNPLPEFSQFELPGLITVTHETKRAQLTIYFPRSSYDDLSSGVLRWLCGRGLAARLQERDYLPLDKQVNQPFELSGQDIEHIRLQVCKLRGV